jgi:hypothetical protein
MSTRAWRLLRAGDDAPAVLCVDYSQTQARAEATFHDLATALPARYPVWGTDEGAWRDEDLPAEPVAEIAGILGFCAGASLACALADRVARRTGPPPPLVLFDPWAVTAAALLHEFGRAVEGVAAGVAPERLDAAKAEVRELLSDYADRSGPRLAPLADALADHYAALARPACAAQRVPERIVDQLCARTRGFLDYLVRSASVPLRCPAPALVVTAAGFEPPPVSGPHRVLHLDVDHPGLLAAPEATATVARVLDGDAEVGQPRSGPSEVRW